MDKETKDRLEDSLKQGRIANQKLVKRYDRMGNDWDRYVPLQRSYFEKLAAIKYLQDDTNVIRDLFIVIPIFMGVIIDYIFFHSPVEYFLKLSVLSETVKAILTIGLLLLYLAIEVKICYTLDHAWKSSEDDPFNMGAKVQKWLFSIGGLIFAGIPAGLFYYVMIFAANDLPLLFTILLCLMSVIIHLFIVFGGELVIRSNDRFFGGMRIAHQDRQRRRGFLKVKRARSKALFCVQHFDRNQRLYLSDGGKIEYYPMMMESELARDIHVFIEKGYNAEHPATLPAPYPRLFGYPHLGGGAIVTR
jgi:hypothetical protein